MKLEETEILKLQYGSNVQTTSRVNNIQECDSNLAKKLLKT